MSELQPISAGHEAQPGSGIANTALPVGYAIRLVTVHVPPDLIGAPLPVEISRLDKAAFEAQPQPAYAQKPTMTARVWAVLALAEEGATEAKVECPGTFVVRADLPTGFKIAETVEVLQYPDEHGLYGTCTLNFAPAAPPLTADGGAGRASHVTKPDYLKAAAGRPAPADSGERAPISSSRPTRQPVSPPGFLIENDSPDDPKRSGGAFLSPNMESDVSERTFRPVPNAEEVQGAFLGVETAMPRPAVQARYGLFHRWLDDKPGLIELDARGGATASLPGDLSLSEHPGAAGAQGGPLPLLVELELTGVGRDRAPTRAVVVWPPTKAGHPLSLLKDPDTNPNPAAPPVLAVGETDQRVADILFSYVRTGVLDAARHLMPALVAEAEALLADKSQDPVLALPAAYTLLKLGETKYNEWIANLADQFPGLPDGSIVYAWCLIRAGEAEKARPYLLSALRAGLPIYSMGVQLLRDGLSFVGGVHPEDQELQSAGQLARRIANGANLRSELTCVSLGSGIDIRFV